MTEKCSNHPDKEVQIQCELCGKHFCDDCITKLRHRTLCHKCLDIELAFEESKHQSKPTSFKSLGWGCALVILLGFAFIAAALLWPHFKLRKHVACRSNLKAIHRALMEYARSFEGKLPPGNNDLRPLMKWSGSDIELNTFVCPSTNNSVTHIAHLKDDSAALDDAGMSYFYQAGLQVPLERGKQPPRVPVVWDQSPANHKNSINVLYLNGEIERISNSFPQIK